MTLKATVAALLIAAAVPAGAETAPGSPDIAERVALVLASEPARSAMPGLMAYFPAEAQRMVDSLREVVSEPDGFSAAGFERLSALNTQIMAPILGMVAQAGDADLVALLDRQIGLLRGIEGQPMLCARFIVQGPAALGADHRYLAEGVLEEAYRQRLAVAHATRDVAPWRGAASDEDYAAIAQALADQGADDAWFDRIAAMDPNDRALCRTFTEYLTVARDAAFPGADRIRADLATVTGLY
ncbi:hypothetical protein [Pararhodobacter aggregans]|uniref:hypothetical protein n=1 Tax=Pararhodobacter aggregans TaxID=404875 RepID=UPI003A8E2590